MMTGEQKSKVAVLKAEIAATAGAGTPLKVRTTVVALKQELRREGVTARDLARAIGVHESTLCGWERKRGTRRDPGVVTKARKRGAGFRVVQIAEATATSKGAPSSSSSLAVRASTSSGHGLRVVHAPSGLVVDGLDVEMLAALLKRMT
jgi:DNA-binding transcriptional regulator YiaG